MRKIILDIETTGLEVAAGHRIIEIGCVELINRRICEKKQWYLNPEHDIDKGAYAVHGISQDFLKDKPIFKEISTELVNFIRDSELIIHNAPFDIGFLNVELERIGKSHVEEYVTVFDTLIFARERHPGLKNSLNALCKRYQVDNSERQAHGALLDAELLTHVFLAMTGGQTAIDFGIQNSATPTTNDTDKKIGQFYHLSHKLSVLKATEAELEAHNKKLEEIQNTSDGKCLWFQIDK